MAEDLRFCPLLTVVKAGQANYTVCKSNCTFYIEDECVFITTSKALKELVKSDTVNQGRKDKSEK